MVRSVGAGLNLLGEADIEDIHLATLGVLERTGVFAEADDALDLYADGGCVSRGTVTWSRFRRTW